MQTGTLKKTLVTIAALAVSLPTALFIATSVLKFSCSAAAPFDMVTPVLEARGLQHGFGWNINLLLLLGPVAALLMAVWQVVQLRFEAGPGSYVFQIAIRKSWLPLFVVAFSISVLTALFMYAVAENFYV